MTGPLLLAIDVGTGSVRAALVDLRGAIVRIDAVEHDQIVPRHGWSEQSPEAWWQGTVASIRRVLGGADDAASRIAAIAPVGQMHGTVLIDAAGQPTRAQVPLWNDKRAEGLVALLDDDAVLSADIMARTANPIIAAWPALKLAWLGRHEPATLERATTVLMPKDWIGFRLTGARATDPSEASLSALADAGSGAWDPWLSERLGVPYRLLPPIVPAHAVIGAVTPAAASATGLRAGTPVVCGAGDFPAAVIGSGAMRPGMGSDITGTSIITTALSAAPRRHPGLSNLAVADGVWGAFMIQDAGGDAMRWARRAFHDNALDYPAIVAMAARSPPGAHGLLFLPYLSGERLGGARRARAQFFGLSRRHDGADLHRAVMEGVALSARHHWRLMAEAGAPVDCVVASGGGAKTDLWLAIKASVYGRPVLVPREAESSVMGAAMLAACGAGLIVDLARASDAMVRFEREVAPRPEWAEVYARAAELFEELRARSIDLYDRLDALEIASGRAAGALDPYPGALP